MDFKKIIKTLNQIDAKDLQNIDLDQVKEYVLSKPTILISSFMILCSLYMSFKHIQKFIGESKTLKTQQTEYQEKLELVKKSKSLISKIGTINESFPEYLEDDLLLQKISQFAVKNNIQIESFSPAKLTKGEYWNLSTIELEISTKNYENLVSFLKDIDSSIYLIRIDNWVTETSRSETLSNNIKNPLLKTNLQIGSIKVNE